MSDEIFRSLERQLQADFDDRDLAAQVLRIRRRSGSYPQLDIRHLKDSRILEIWDVLAGLDAADSRPVSGVDVVHYPYGSKRLDWAIDYATRETQISAEAHSDDYQVEVTFDAFDWFEQASDAEIVALAEIGWGGDYESDAVAQFFEKTSTQELFEYLEDPESRPCGFECHVDKKGAMHWISENRPHLLKNLV